MTFSSDIDLGTPLEVHGINYVRLLSKFLIALLLLVVAFTFGLYKQPLWFIIFLILISPYLVFLPIIRLTRQPKIELFENGLRAAKMTYYWIEIDGITKTYMLEILTLGDFYIGEMRLFKNNEQVLAINYDYAQTEKLFAVIEAKTANFLVPTYLSELRLKGEVSIGPVTLTPQQVTAGRQRVNLTEIQRMSFGSNLFTISKHQGMLGITSALVASVAYVKNYHLLVPLINLLAQDAQT